MYAYALPVGALWKQRIFVVVTDTTVTATVLGVHAKRPVNIGEGLLAWNGRHSQNALHFLNNYKEFFGWTRWWHYNLHLVYPRELLAFTERKPKRFVNGTHMERATHFVPCAAGTLEGRSIQSSSSDSGQVANAALYSWEVWLRILYVL